jgi:pimeloyl-ACP methyl ester carboxylesterase
MQVKFFQASSGARIAYAVEGSGPPLILLPAWASHLEAFWELPGHRRLCGRLAASHTVVMYDRWGTGLSDRTRTDLSLDADVQVLADVVGHLRLRRVALFGPSHGAPTAAAYANQAPQTVSHLFLYSAAVPGTGGCAVWQAFRQLMLADWQVGSLAFSSVLMCGADEAEIVAFAKLWRRCSSAEMSVGLQDTAVRLDASQIFDHLRVPTMVVSRRGDPVGPPERFRHLAARIPGSDLVILDGDAHLPHEGDVDALCDALLDFLRRGRRTASWAAAPTGPAQALTQRESEILDLVAGGLSNQAIGERLHLSVRTVERHTLNIYRKLDAANRAEAVSPGARRGLISL